MKKIICIILVIILITLSSCVSNINQESNIISNNETTAKTDIVHNESSNISSYETTIISNDTIYETLDTISTFISLDTSLSYSTTNEIQSSLIDTSFIQTTTTESINVAQTETTSSIYIIQTEETFSYIESQTIDTESVTESLVSSSMIQTETSTSLLITESETIKNPEEPHYYSYNSPSFWPQATIRGNNTIYMFIGNAEYYDTTYDEIYPICFDPLCTHSTKSCIAYQFGVWSGLGVAAKRIFNSYNSRIYATRGDNIFSFKPSGSDLRLELSLGETGKVFSNILLPATYFESLDYFDNFLFFIHKSQEKGDDGNLYTANILYKFDTKTKQLTRLLTQDQSGNNRCDALRVIGNNKLLVYGFFNGDYRSYVYSFDLKDEVLIEDAIHVVSYGFSHLLNSTSLYYCIVKDDVYSLKKLDTKTLQITEILNTTNVIQLFDIDDDYLYFTCSEKFLVDEQEFYGKISYSYNDNHTLYRMSTNDYSQTLLFEGLTSYDRYDTSYGIDLFVKINKNKFLVVRNKYEYDYSRDKWTNGATQFIVDINSPNWFE